MSSLEKHKHHWRAYGQPDGLLVCDGCNVGIEVNGLIEAEANRRVVETLTQLLDSQIIKPEYHNGVVGQVMVLKRQLEKGSEE